jgi:protoporphyrinogen oxidase
MLVRRIGKDRSLPRFALKVELEMKPEYDVVVLGAGLAGLSVASELFNSALVLERSDRPGGLVRTECFDGYWFDHVLHLLHFQDDETEALLRPLVDAHLKPCPPRAWVETLAGTVPFPFQMNLGSLDDDVIARSLRDLAAATFSDDTSKPVHFEELLVRMFGQTMCDIFMLPYNRKMWRRPLNSLAPAGFTWNIAHPDFNDVVRGALARSSGFAPYNARGWYPRPPEGAPLRGMELISQRLARLIPNLLLNHTVEEIDPINKTVIVSALGQTARYSYQHECVSTLPLPQTVLRCKNAPPRLRDACRTLTHNRVYTAAFSIKGPRPQDRGHWRYYADESVLFTRLVYMHEFDPHSAPADGWGLMAEITERSECPIGSARDILATCVEDLGRVGAIPEGCEIVDQNLILADPAYVVFTPENQSVVSESRGFLESQGVLTVGRYGRWEYSSMMQVIRDGLAVGRGIASQLGATLDVVSDDDVESRVA